MYKRINDTYLGRLFHEDRKLFFWIAGFFLLTIACNFTKLQMTPFFLWGMYSEKEEKLSSYSVLEISVNNTNIVDYSAGYSDNTRFFLSSPIFFYQRMRNNEDKDPTLSFIEQKSAPIASFISRDFPSVLNTGADLRNFSNWYRRYLQSVTGLYTKTVKIKEVQAHYNLAGYLVTDSTHLFEEWQY